MLITLPSQIIACRARPLLAVICSLTLGKAQAQEFGLKPSANYGITTVEKRQDWHEAYDGTHTLRVPLNSSGGGGGLGIYYDVSGRRNVSYSFELDATWYGLHATYDLSKNLSGTAEEFQVEDKGTRNAYHFGIEVSPVVLKIRLVRGLVAHLGVTGAFMLYSNVIERGERKVADGLWNAYEFNTNVHDERFDYPSGDQITAQGYQSYSMAPRLSGIAGLAYEIPNGMGFSLRYYAPISPFLTAPTLFRMDLHSFRIALFVPLVRESAYSNWGGKRPTCCIPPDTTLFTRSSAILASDTSRARSTDSIARSITPPNPIPPAPPSVAHLPKKEAVPLLQHRVDSLWREVSNTRAKLEAQEAAIAALSAELAKGSATAAVPPASKDSAAYSSTLATQRAAEPNAGAATPSQVRAAQQADSLSKQWLGEVERDLSRARTIEALNATSEPDDKRYLLTAAELDSVDALLSRITTFALQRCLEVPEYKTKLDPSVIDSHTILHAFSDPWQLDTFQVTTTRKPGGQLMHFMTITSHTGKLLYKEELFVGVLEEGAENCGDSYEQLQVRSAVSCGRFAFPAINARLLGLHIDRARNGRVFDVDEPTWEGIQGDCTAVSFSFRATAEEARVLVYSKQLGKVVNLEPMHP